MPQASEEDRDRAEKLFGDRISDAGPTEYLEKRGWVLTHEFTWRPPSPTHRASDEERFAIWFLIEEWDYGGVVE